MAKSQNYYILSLGRLLQQSGATSPTTMGRLLLTPGMISPRASSPWADISQGEFSANPDGANVGTCYYVSMIQIISFPFCIMENCENDFLYFSVSVYNLTYQLEPLLKTNNEEKVMTRHVLRMSNYSK